jgi:pimeloyl-ACP methyl ester carboxylesterase
VGKNDKIFPPDGAHPYKRDLPEIEFHLIDTGHFVLEDRADEVVPLIRVFLERTRCLIGASRHERLIDLQTQLA